ncbi:sensor histidine kinase [Streptacidiphilus rugosus]|uniref:sensor histidine kinase n=1 Tax=Streptacidiphilus rugosus TaxID=405783 RepID=UPI0007C73A49|nr:histidine kinase [Streptacidiphilus rugosus]
MDISTDPLWDHPVARGWLRVRAFDRAHPQVLDSCIALFVLLVGLADLFRGGGEHHELFGQRAVAVWVIPLTAAAQALPLVWRRRRPWLVVWVVLAVCAVQWAFGVAARSDISLMIALYGAARYLPPKRLPWIAAGVLPCCAVLAWRVQPLSRQPWAGLFFVSCAAVAAAALGLAGRIRQAQLAALADRAATLEVEREQREQLAAATERARVSRELHDIVGHSLAIIIGLADGGAAQAELRPERGPEVLRIIAAAGRESLGELRRTLGALRAELPDEEGETATPPELHPQPGAADLGALCERIRAAGPTVTWTSSGDTAALPAGLQLAVYRIVQEALTNCLKHAGPRTDVHVSVAADARAGEVRVSVDDSGPDREGRESSDLPPTGRPAGHGLIGIRERAALAGGSASAGPRPGGGWSVRAVLPFTATLGPRGLARHHLDTTGGDSEERQQ